MKILFSLYKTDDMNSFVSTLLYIIAEDLIVVVVVCVVNLHVMFFPSSTIHRTSFTHADNIRPQRLLNEVLLTTFVM